MSADLSLWAKTFGNKNTISCGKAMKLIQPALDGELDQESLDRLNRHLAACQHCGMTADTYRAIKTSIASRGAAPLPSDVLADLESIARNLPER